ncbi:hypothetical protein K3495_g8750 [Podosphaera aphanis]|nr:hypothetical protein K3495_g8750 [Podosphaera aphanis]
MTSDHLPLRGYVPAAKASMKPELTKLRVPKENLPSYVQATSQWIHPPPPLNSSDDVEKYTEELCFHLTNAIKATGTRPKKGKGKAAAWWTPRCKAVHAEYRAATDSAERRITGKNLRTIITAAKKEHKTRKIEGMTTLADVFKLIQTFSPRQASVPPPLMYEGRLVTN